MRKKKNITNIILVLVILTGLTLLLYPTVANWWNQRHQTRAVASYVEKVAEMSDKTQENMWNEAAAYNEKLASQPQSYILSDEETERYNKILDVTGTGIMGYVQIPKIHVELPIYHGTDPAVLQIAIGHIAGSSLPVGGGSSHCVISGHRGLASARLFTDLDKLDVGDSFKLQVLDRTLTYEVDQVRIVLPDELSDLQIEEGKDYCTLVTCTPYGVNTHRLLVRGHRTDNKDDSLRVKADASQINPMYVVPFILAGMIVVILIWILILKAFRRR